MRLIQGDCLEVLATLPDCSVQCVVTSPPYYWLRDYGTSRWEGGDPVCDHTQSRKNGRETSTITGGQPARNKRSVWSVVTKSYKEAHFATYPPKLIEPCILAGSRPGDVVLDPFNGAGTTGLVAMENGRDYIGIELNPEYIKLTEKRLKNLQGKMI